MNSVKLTDLDELILNVRDKTSRSYISEAVNAYRGSAYRAAIVATWIAVSYDIIAKIKELAIQGDTQANNFIKTLNQAIEKRDISKLQKIEENLIDNAYNIDNGFGFLLQHEYTDLKRLKEDRNLCAHPAFIAEEELFQPTPELVRTHIVHAVVHLMQHHPVQGKSAIQRIMSEIREETLFPKDLETACTYLNAKYLNRAKDSLIRNLIDVLVKTLLQREDPDFIGKEILMTSTLKAVQRIHPIIYQERMSEKLPYIVEGLKNNQMASIFRLLSADIRCWNWLKEENRIRIKELLGYIKTKVSLDNTSNFLLRKKDNEILRKIIDYKIFDVLNLVDIQLLLMEIFDEMDSFSKETIIAEHPNPIFAEEAIKIYSEASSYNHSEILGNTVLIPMGSYFSSVQVKKVLDAIMNNNQIYNASGTPKVIEHFLDVTIVHLESSQKWWKALANFFTEEGHFDEDGRSWEMYDSWGYSSLKKTFQKYNII